MALPSDILRQKLLRAGAGAVGFAALREVAPEVMEEYTAWLSRGNHGSMEYLANHTAIRRNPALLLDGDQDPRPEAPSSAPHSHTPRATTTALAVCA